MDTVLLFLKFGKFWLKIPLSLNDYLGGKSGNCLVLASLCFCFTTVSIRICSSVEMA